MKTIGVVLLLVTIFVTVLSSAHSSVVADENQHKQICRPPKDFPSDAVHYKLDCDLVTKSFTNGTYPATDVEDIKVMEYNMEQGTHWKELTEKLLRMERIPDIMLLSELDRYCNRTGNVFALEEIAKRLKMNYVYAVEFLDGFVGRESICTTGNAILTRFEIKDASWGFFNHQCCFFSNRLGGRSWAKATLTIPLGGGQYHTSQAGSTHLESGTSVWDFLKSQKTRQEQAKEFEQALSTGPASAQSYFVGGDFNCFLQKASACNTPFQNGNYYYVLSVLNFWEIKTSGFLALDYLYTKSETCQGDMDCEKKCTSHTEIGTKEEWGNLSDHLPVMTVMNRACL
eukprot:Nk52_evm19s348 gene=Nk52_evmTU19s348